jgi:hypothetical protein
MKPVSFLFVLILLFCAGYEKHSVGNVVPPGFEERLLATIPDGFNDVSQETFSPAGKLVAYVVRAKLRAAPAIAQNL